MRLNSYVEFRGIEFGTALNYHVSMAKNVYPPCSVECSCGAKTTLVLVREVLDINGGHRED